MEFERNAKMKKLMMVLCALYRAGGDGGGGAGAGIG